MVDILTTLITAAIAFGYAALLSTVVAKQSSEPAPAPSWWQAGVVSGLIAGVTQRVADEPQIAVFLGAVAALLVVPSWVDAMSKRLPNAMMLHLFAVGAGMFGYTAVNLPGFWGQPASAVAISVTAFFVVFVMFSLVTRGGMGMGDAKYGPGLLLVLLLVTLWAKEPVDPLITTAVLIITGCLWLCVSFLSAGVFVVVHLIRGKRDSVPFGPFLAGGFAVMVPVVTVVDSVPILGF